MNRKIRRENNEYSMNEQQRRYTGQTFMNDIYKRDPQFCPSTPLCLQKGEMMEAEIQQRDDQDSGM